MKKEDTKIEYPKHIQLLMQLGGLIMVSVGLFFFNLSWQIGNIQIIPIGIGCLFLILGVTFFAEGYRIIIVNLEGIKQKNLITQSKISKNQIKGYAEIVQKNSKGKSTQLIVFSNNKKEFLKIEKETWEDKYLVLLKRIKLDYKRVGFEEINQITKRRKSLYKNIGKGFGIFVFICGLYQLLFTDIIPPKKFQNLDGIIAEQPIIEEKRKGRIENINFKLNKYSEFRFRVAGAKFRILHPNAKKLNKGDKVSFLVLKSEVQQKIDNSITPDFKNKQVNRNIIELYGIEYKGQTLLNIKDINSSRKNPMPKIFLMIFGIGTFLYYQYVSKGYD